MPRLDHPDRRRCRILGTPYFATHHTKGCPTRDPLPLRRSRGTSMRARYSLAVYATDLYEKLLRRCERRLNQEISSARRNNRRRRLARCQLSGLFQI